MNSIPFSLIDSISFQFLNVGSQEKGFSHLIILPHLYIPNFPLINCYHYPRDYQSALGNTQSSTTVISNSLEITNEEYDYILPRPRKLDIYM